MNLVDDGTYPPVEFFENEKEYLMVCDLPGFNQDEVHLTFKQSILKIHAKGKAGELIRTFQIPPALKGSIKAKYVQGALEITLPKTGLEAKGREIEVQ